MKKSIILGFAFLLCFSLAQAQEKSLKEQALDEFKKEHYNEAISLLEKAAIETPHDAEVYYYLGWFNHYRAYDSRPLNGYDFSYSKKIFAYFEKALALNPDYGDAKYFYGAECSANAFIAMQNYDLKQLKYYYQKAAEKGAYPAWLIEYGKNYLNTCDPNAILFTGGNPDFDVCMYLQLHHNYRTDVTLVPIGNIDRPAYVRFIKNGLKGGVRNVNILLDEDQIMDIHPYKWDTTSVSIPVSEALKNEFNLAPDYQLTLDITPDLISNRMHSKIQSEKAKKRTYLSPQRAILLHIVEANFAERPIYFTNFVDSSFYGGLNIYFQDCGMLSRLIPVKVSETPNSIHEQKFEALLKAENLKDLQSVKTNNIPRISGIVFAYYQATNRLAQKYKQTQQTEKLKKLIGLYKSHIILGWDPEYEAQILKSISE